MNITIKIEAPGLVAAIQALAGAIESNPVQAPLVNSMTKNEEVEPEKINSSDKEEKTVVAPPVEEDKPSVIKLETVRAKLAGLSQKGKQAEVKALLNQFDAKKLTDVPEDKYADLLAAAEEL